MSDAITEGIQDMTTTELANRQLAEVGADAITAPSLAGRSRLRSSIQAIGMALMLFAGAFSVGYADHMGNHLRPHTESSDSTTNSGFACGSDGAGVLSATEATESVAEDEAIQTRPIDGRPW